ncbi:MAG TPA: transglycosylase SLT domain-containing protein [Myxococcota bacterium]|nr:transglycosylase SLT domain-containing protein [Myxococcota bacterium]
MRERAIYSMGESSLLCLIFYLIFAPSLRGNQLLEPRLIYQRYDQGHYRKQPAPLLGLQIDKLQGEQKTALAKTHLKRSQRQKNTPQEVVKWRLLQIASREKDLGDFRKNLKDLSELRFFKVTDLMRELYQDLPKKEQKLLLNRMIKAGFFIPRPDSNCPYFELLQRKNRADFLYQLAREQNLPANVRTQVFHELFILLPEAVESDALSKLEGFKEFSLKQKPADLIRRMETLLTFGKNQEARRTFNDTLAQGRKLSEADLCELNYVDAKVARKMKKIDVARKKFSDIAESCESTTKKKAEFMGLMLASMKSDAASLPGFEKFLAAYPNDSLADDALLFKATLLFDLARVEDARDVLAKIKELYPNGDMIHRALFAKAFSFAKSGDIDRAMESLAELLQISPKNSLDYASARYWTARLSLFSDLASLKNPEQRKLFDAKTQLNELVRSPSPTVYSWLALILLEYLRAGPKDLFLPHLPDPEKKMHGAMSKDLLFIKELINTGFRQEALIFLLASSIDPNDIDLAMTMANFFDVLNRHDAAHQKLVRCNSELASAIFRTFPATFWKIAYPRPFEQEVAQALARVDIPKPLVFGVMREESGFITHSCSWAGAKGLMQLMFSSARAEAKKWSMPNLLEKDLYLPKVNILLGSSLLQRYWQQYGNLAVGLAAYNAGPTLARTWLKKNQDAPVDTFIENIDVKETNSYVKGVLGHTFTYAMLDGLDLLPRLAIQVERPVAEKQGF